MKSKSSILYVLTFQCLVPLVGLIFFGWDWREILIFYWLTNITIGVLTIIDMIRTTSTETPRSSRISPPADVPQAALFANPPFAAIRIFMTGFFTVHYGFFTLIHGIFVFTFAGGGYNNIEKHDLTMGPILLAWLISFIGMVAIRFVSLPSALPIQKIMTGAYKRVLPLHLAIIAGGFIILTFDFGTGAAVVLILLSAVAEIMSQKKTPTSWALLRIR